MASILRQIVAGPRARHPEAGLDLCYVTDNIIATSGPSGTYPQLAYRTPLDQLRKFLDEKHGDDWAIWEFRAEGTGYPDSEVYNRVYHYPWPDHHPPPFGLIPLIMGSMRNWRQDPNISEEHRQKRVTVVHCKAGKGRSGTVSCSYLISEEGWTKEDALKRFTERRMRPNFGAGVSIPSQLRWVGYVERWAKTGKVYVERPVEILEVHIWGLRDGVKVAVEGFVDDGRTIKVLHVFSKSEREIVRGGLRKSAGLADVVVEAMKMGNNNSNNKAVHTASMEPTDERAMAESNKTTTRAPSDLADGKTGDVVFRPKESLVVPTGDINIDFERRNKAGYGMSMVTSVAHVWFNTFFEGQGPERNGEADDAGVFEIDFDAMDGIKGSLRKGTRAFDKMAVVWKNVPETRTRRNSVVIKEPELGEEVHQTKAADWKGIPDASPGRGKKGLGLRAETPHSADVSRASSVRSHRGDDDTGSESEGVTSYGIDGQVNQTRLSGETSRSILPTSKDLPGPTHSIVIDDGKVLED
ncbi:hypothetical protein AAFC00_002243 [Neodothiora populina]|uniref:phosphatidylinositol-3,4,5-trisphosphate 3-phosphatase n=1 Tax=Neodothiora populina TaxID=2781224 RepID=A0ABR3PHX4_9PEZI